jgi:hypothetical protein
MSSENPSGGISLAKNPAPLTERAPFALSGWSVLLGGRDQRATLLGDRKSGDLRRRESR